MQTRYAELSALVIDDHPFQLLAAEQLLTQLGVSDVHCASDGRIALDLLAARKVDLVLCDIEMPGLNGPAMMDELTRRAEHAFAGAQPLWVWVSALEDDIIDSHVSLADSVGLVHVRAVRKPISVVMLEEILQDALERDLTARVPAAPASQPDDRELLAALKTSGAIFIMLQPQFRIGSGELAGAEALCRWRHPDLGLIRPDLFIPRLEALGEADAVFHLAGRQCLTVQQQLLARGVRIPLSINASAQTLCRPGVLDAFDAMVEASGMPRQLLIIELTEGYPVHDTRALSISLNRLRLLGYGVAIDDFGIGIATLKLLADLPFTQIKLDRSFVVAVPGNSQRAAICRNVINLARDLKLECVAEGIETPAQRDALLALGCDLGQGYLWSPALPPDMFVAETLGRWTP
ncbi:EAL domain-containing response regulator [Cupriavidus basilensis]|uniref:EAL domain-containing response regulator n=1 Tax=Cupriavidus basilensis TaxID=68895 RepID=A0ABT6ATL8_9BURK|nr:EAL domain-containing response regulator [Cupriavidus basilensis]MDF3835966.1 EAL domain-containing response regulator [Cupriavidus basilensis]